MTRRRAKEEVAPQAAGDDVRFTQITGGTSGLYALDQEGRVFYFDSQPPPGEQEGWFQLEYDDTRGTEEENAGTVEVSPGKKFVQITGGGEFSLYALDETGRTYFYDDDGQGWFQLEYDDARSLAEEVSE